MGPAVGVLEAGNVGHVHVEGVAVVGIKVFGADREIVKHAILKSAAQHPTGLGG